ncbi:MAG TPA: DUF952 domain-containing protein [Phycisphaerae bacterium]|nr:DUF952 domain-containing protein [Phycisphaerae bacterium]HUT61741.1 DUF952 domain-containing protein [Phycisphaerae bacterium]
MGIILHITKRESWEEGQRAGAYAAPSLQRQGFIHCSTADQVIRVADFLFRGQRDLVLLCVDEQRLAHEVRYENLEGGETEFPHVYGAVNPDAVVGVVDFPPRADGTFELPADVERMMTET